MKIQSVNIKNFKGLKNVQEEINGKNVYLIGGNKAGKTSFIDAIWVGLTGKGIPPEPTTNRAKKGLIELDLGEFIARTKFTKGKPTRFELENKEFTNESEKFVKSPRAYLESRIGVLNFDITDFFAKSEAQKLAYFSKVMNTDFSDLDADIEEIAESRAFDKRLLPAARSKVGFYDESEAKKDIVDIVGLSKKVAAAQEKARTYEKVLDGMEERRGQVAEKEAEILKLRAEIDGKLAEDILNGEAWLDEAANKPLTDLALAELEQSLENANEYNEVIREAKTAQEADIEADRLEKSIETANEDIEKKRQEKAARIGENINVPGLTYDAEAEAFLYEGLPFAATQQNTAAQLIAGMRIASTMLKDLKILKVDASLIDKENFEEVLAWAASEDIELFIELVDREATQLQIHICDE
jgi:hypothetical protein